MERTIGFEEFRWLQELGSKARRVQVPLSVSAMLLVRGLIAPRADGFELTARGRIALAKLA